MSVHTTAGTQRTHSCPRPRNVRLRLACRRRRTNRSAAPTAGHTDGTWTGDPDQLRHCDGYKHIWIKRQAWGALVNLSGSDVGGWHNGGYPAQVMHEHASQCTRHKETRLERIQLQLARINVKLHQKREFFLPRRRENTAVSRSIRVWPLLTGSRAIIATYTPLLQPKHL